MTFQSEVQSTENISDQEAEVALGTDGTIISLEYMFGIASLTGQPSTKQL